MGIVRNSLEKIEWSKVKLHFIHLPSWELQLRKIVLEKKQKEYLSMDRIVILMDMALPELDY